VDYNQSYSRFTYKVYCITGTRRAKVWDCQSGIKTINHHLFADDQVITAQDKVDAEYTTKKLKEYKKWGLNEHILKTEYLNV